MRKIFAFLLAFALTAPAQYVPTNTLAGRQIASAGGGTTVTFDAATHFECDGSGQGPQCTTNTVASFTHVTTTNANRGMVVNVCVGATTGLTAPLVSTVTYNSVSLSQTVHKAVGAPQYYCDLWQLPNGTQPATGSNTVVVTLAGALPSIFSSVLVTAITAYNVNQTTALSVTGSNNGVGTSTTLTLGASGANDLVFAESCNGDSIGTSGNTSIHVTNYSTHNGCGTHAASRAAGNTTSISWTGDSNDNWVVVAGAFKN